MDVQAYLQASLEDLLHVVEGIETPTADQLTAEVTRLVLSKKFRKYSVAAKPLEHIKASVKASVEAGEPVKFTLPFGAYKLWRLDETPEADWAELFAMMYFTKYLKPICAIYGPGAWFDFFSDDIIVPKINNISPEDLQAYNRSFHRLLDFIRPYQPKNLKMTLTRVGDRYDSQADFDQELARNTAKLASELEGGLPVLDDAQRATVELNVKTTPEQRRDPLWREKVQLSMDAYGSASQRRPYYRDPAAHKIMVVTTPLWNELSLGSTKDSIMKFWIGVGVLKPRDDSFRQLVLSPSQLEKTTFRLEPVKIDGLDGRNFHSIRVMS